MGIADLVDTINTAARTALPGVKCALAEDTIADLPAFVVGWPSDQVLNVTLAGGRDIELAVAIYISVGADATKAWQACQAVIDGPLIGALNEAMQPTGIVTSIGQVVPVTVGAEFRALRIPLNLSTTI
jgi:hypothetical protein